jgi:hypothetical protein
MIRAERLATPQGLYRSYDIALLRALVLPRVLLLRALLIPRRSVSVALLDVLRVPLLAEGVGEVPDGITGGHVVFALVTCGGNASNAP